MKYSKQFFATLLAVVLIFSITPFAISASVPEKWSDEWVETLHRLYHFQVMDSYGDDVANAVISIRRNDVEIATVTTNESGFAAYLTTTHDAYSAEIIEAPGFDLTTVEFFGSVFSMALERDGQYVYAVTLAWQICAYIPLEAVPSEPISQDIRILLDGVLLESDVPPIIINGRTMVPLRVISEALGAEVGWEGETRTITISTADTSAIMVVDNDTVVVVTNGQESIIVLDVAPIIMYGRTLVPLRFIAELFGNDVDWDGSTRTIFIITEQ